MWVARYMNQYNKFGGRVMIGWVGFHDDAASAWKEARKRYPDIDPAELLVQPA
jgi:hypothetical protein